MENKKIFIVLGMARSGTSVMTRALKALGVDLGNAFAPTNSVWNPTGFWEDKDIVYKINGRVFNTLGFQPYGVTLPENLSSSDLGPIRKDAKTLLQQRFATTQAWGFKDPSTIKLLPFWQSIFGELNLQENYLIALRHPLSVAHSYSRLTGTDLEVSLLLWCVHLMQALKGTQGKRRIIVSYEAMLKDPLNELTRIKNAFGLTVNSADEVSFANEFLKKELHRNDHTQQNLSSHPALNLTPFADKFYDFMLSLARDENFDEHQWQTLQTEFEKLAPFYSYLDKILKQHNQLNNRLKNIEKSLPWKLISPLRKIDDFFREKRQKKRLGRRINKAYS